MKPTIGTLIQSENQLTVIDYYGNIIKSKLTNDYAIAFDDDRILIFKAKNDVETETRIQLLDCFLDVVETYCSEKDDYCNQLLNKNYRLFMVYDRPFSMDDYLDLICFWPNMTYENRTEGVAKLAHSLFFQFLEYQQKKKVKIIYSDRFMFHYLAVFKEEIYKQVSQSNVGFIFNRLESVFEKIIN
jgi:hypothetical protein